MYTYVRIYIYTLLHKYIYKYQPFYIYTYLYLLIYVGTYILHPTYPTGGAGEAEVLCMIIGFQGGSTPNPRNHPHRAGGGYRPVPYIFRKKIEFSQSRPL